MSNRATLSGRIKVAFSFRDDNEPLFLTPYLQSGQIQRAKNLSLVRGLPNAPNVTSYSGLFTVQQQFNNNLFFWFFPAMNNDPNAPVILWLQGGPGTTSLFGLFIEHGPYVLQADMSAKIRPYHWAKTFHVIYVDSPVGAGFSFTKTKGGYCINELDVATDLFEFLRQFFTMFPEYKKNDFYIAGESYGGKYATSLGYMIHTEGASEKINLKGIAIGNGFLDPETMLDYSSYLYQLGLIDRKQASVMHNVSETIKQHIRRKEYYEAVVGMDQLVMQLHTLPYTSYFANYTDYQFTYNFLVTNWPDDYGYYFKYVKSPEFKKAVHVGNLTFNDGSMAQKSLLLDVMQSVKPQMAVLMDNYKVLLYSGQLDLLVPYPLTLNFLHSVKWKNATAYKDAEREIWKIEGTDEIAGFVHNVGDFYEVLVRNAGHLVPHDQPRAALDLITRFIRQKPFA
ncbi:probable serine carboxypeptidase CPVL [Nephila pilipes]|uniref:Carboxypeptidase n=1 Tax=Nephila pilipes TaxID=299642 RepID=A0A8X6P8L3_NEPPI|nr:probable serine carboxypeptidase CPVL [Nephila pilipes]